MTCTAIVCGTGGWNGPKPGDPDNNLALTAVPAFGGIDVAWSFPGTNPHAVAHVLLYRATSPNRNSANQISVVSGNFYYDKLNSAATFYYWIRVVSVNGTTGEWIGPASASPRKLIDDLLVELTGKIDAGVLSNSLRQEIDKIALSYEELGKEIEDRLAQNSALSAALALIDSRANEVEVFVQNEITKRIVGDNALVQQVQLIAAANANNTSLITNERLTRVSADEALARDVSALYVRTNTNAAAVLQETQARTTADSALASDISSLVAKTNATNGLIESERSLRISGDAAVATIANSARVAAENAGAATREIATTKIGYSALAGGLGTPYDGNGTTEVYPASVFPANTFPEYAANRKKIIDKEGVARWNATTAGAAKPLVWVTGMPLASAIKQVEVIGPNGEAASVEQSMAAQRDLNNGFKALYTAKISVNGLIGGFGLFNDGAAVEAGFDVDRFYVGRTNANKKKPFIIENDEVFIDQAVIQSLTFSKLRDESGAFIVVDGKVQAKYLSVNNASISGSIFSSNWEPSGGNAGWLLDRSGNFHANSGTFGGVLTSKAVNAVNTINIAGNAVTVPVGGAGNGAFPTYYLNMPHGGNILVIVTANYIATDASAASVGLKSVCNGVEGPMISVSLGDGASGSSTAVASFPVGPGTHAVSGNWIITAGTRTLSVTSVVAIGAQR